MRIITLLLILVQIVFTSLYGEKLGELEDVFKPEAMRVFNNKVYVVQAEKVLIFDLNGLKKIGEFGKKGTGPGESQIVTNFENTIEVGSQGIIVENFYKFLKYSGDYKYRSEVKKGAEIRLLVGVRFAGEGFIGSRIKVEGAQNMSTTIILTDDMFKPVKELHVQKLGQEGRMVNPVASNPGYVVVDNKIFLNKGNKGLIIDVYNLEGNKLYRIEKSVRAVRIDSVFKKKIIDEFRKDPKMVAQIKAAGGWNAFKKIITLDIPAVCPSIMSLDSDGKVLIARTYNRNSDDEDEFIVMDLKGKELKRVHIGIPRLGVIEKKIGRGVKKYGFENGRVYWLHDNEDEETVELHSKKVY